MTTETASLTVGAVAAIGSLALQQTTGQPTSTSFVVPVLSALVGGAISYGVLKTTVAKLEERFKAHEDNVRDRFKDHEQQVRANTGEIYGLLRDCMTQLAHIEGRLDQKP